MNRRTLAIIILLVIQSTILQAQTTLKHIKGAKSVLIESTLSPSTYGTELGITHWFSTKWSLDSKIGYQYNNQPYTKTHAAIIEEQISFNILNIRNRIYTDLEYSIEAGIDHKKSTIEEKQANSILLMTSLGIKLRYYINYRWSIIGEVSQYIGKSETIKTQPKFKIGGSMMIHNLKKSVRKIG